MNAQLTSHMLNFKYEKPSGEISRKAAAKADELEAKAVEREGRVSKLREEYGITDAMLADLLRQVRETQRAGGVTSGGRMSYTVSNASGLALGNGTAARQESSGPGEVVVGAGVLNHLLTEGGPHRGRAQRRTSTAHDREEHRGLAGRQTRRVARLQTRTRADA